MMLNVLICNDMPLHAAQWCATVRAAWFWHRAMYPMDLYTQFWQAPSGLLVGLN